MQYSNLKRYKGMLQISKEKILWNIKIIIPRNCIVVKNAHFLITKCYKLQIIIDHIHKLALMSPSWHKIFVSIIHIFNKWISLKIGWNMEPIIILKSVFFKIYVGYVKDFCFSLLFFTCVKHTVIVFEKR